MGKNSAIIILVFGLLMIPGVYFARQPAFPTKVATAAQKKAYEPVVVLELFTSQGCSSCPPADRLLQQLVKSGSAPVFGVSYHVDYWNYIGWTDPFSKAEYTAMQRAYNEKLKSRTNYTPELVINGKEHVVGSDEAKIRSRIKAYSQQPASNAVTLHGMNRNGDKITANYEVLGETEGRHIKAILLLDDRSTYVKRGENNGRTLQNSQIALAVKEIAVDNSHGQVQFAIPQLVASGDLLYLLLITENNNFDITGASRIKVPSKS